MTTRRARAGFGMRYVVLGMKVRNVSREAKDGAPRIAYCEHLRLLWVCFETEL